MNEREAAEQAQAEAPPPEAPPPGSNGAEQAGQAADTWDQDASDVVDTALGAAVALYGPHWAPDSEAQVAALKSALGRVFKKYAVTQLRWAPEIALATAVLAFTLPRYQESMRMQKAAKAAKARERTIDVQPIE